LPSLRTREGLVPNVMWTWRRKENKNENFYIHSSLWSQNPI